MFGNRPPRAHLISRSDKYPRVPTVRTANGNPRVASSVSPRFAIFRVSSLLKRTTTGCHLSTSGRLCFWGLGHGFGSGFGSRFSVSNSPGLAECVRSPCGLRNREPPSQRRSFPEPSAASPSPPNMRSGNRDRSPRRSWKREDRITRPLHGHSASVVGNTLTFLWCPIRCPVIDYSDHLARSFGKEMRLQVAEIASQDPSFEIC
jgi:hypothetical protein